MPIWTYSFSNKSAKSGKEKILALILASAFPSQLILSFRFRNLGHFASISSLNSGLEQCQSLGLTEIPSEGNQAGAQRHGLIGNRAHFIGIKMFAAWNSPSSQLRGTCWTAGASVGYILICSADFLRCLTVCEYRDGCERGHQSPAGRSSGSIQGRPVSGGHRHEHRHISNLN